MNSELEIVVSQEEGQVPVTVYHLKGVIGANTYERLEAQAAGDVANGMLNLLLDLSEVTYMSSAGLRTLHDIFVMLQADTTDGSSQAMRQGMMAGTYKSPNLKLLNPPPDVLRVIKIQGFDMFLEILSDYKKAIASF
jgi:anti-anti-sigma factor